MREQQDLFARTKTEIDGWKEKMSRTEGEMEEKKRRVCDLEGMLEKEQNEMKECERRVAVMEGRLAEQHTLYKELMRTNSFLQEEIRNLKEQMSKLEHDVFSGETGEHDEGVSDVSVPTLQEQDQSEKDSLTEKLVSVFLSKRRERN